MGAKLRQAKSEDEIKQTTVGQVRKEYNLLAEDYNKIINQEVILCPKCNEFKKAKPSPSATFCDFYRDKRWSSGVFPVCKDCLKLMAEQRKSHREPSKECKESVQRVLRFMDRAYIDDWYTQCVQNVRDQNADAGIFDENPSAFATYIRGLSSLPQYSNFKCWEDSIFGEDGSIDDKLEEETKIVKSTVVKGKKRFGEGYSDADYMYLETEYEDWVSRNECQTKAQELCFENISTARLVRHKLMLKGESTKDIDKIIQDYMDSGNLKPKQNNMDAFSDAQTMGTILKRCEEERPLPKVAPEHEDVEHWGMYVDAFFRGHGSKMFGFKNRYSNIYDNVMREFTATLPEYEDEEDTEALFDKVFNAQKEV